MLIFHVFVSCLFCAQFDNTVSENASTVYMKSSRLLYIIISNYKACKGAANNVKTVACGAQMSELGNALLDGTVKEVFFILRFQMDEPHYH